jgi:transposase
MDLKNIMVAMRTTANAKATRTPTARAEGGGHLKLIVEKLRHMIFGNKSEKIVIKLEQLQLELEEEETTHAESEAAAERVRLRNSGSQDLNASRCPTLP